MQSIKVLVGTDRKVCSLSRKAVRLTMPSIESALSGLGEEETHNTLVLPHVEPTTFEYMREWAISRDIDLPCNDGGTNSSIFWSVLTNVYILAEDMNAIKLKRYIIDTIYASIRDEGYGPNDDTIRLIYRQTSHSSGLRQIVVAFFVWQATEGWWNIDQDTDDKDDWRFRDMPEEFKTEVAVATFERVHLMDDGNPFNDAHETEETGFGPNYFYDDDEARAASQKWLRNDPEGLRPEEEWDAACFQVEKETADDHAMINDDEKAIRQEEMEAENSKDVAGSGEDRMNEDSSDSDESKLELTNWLELELVDRNKAMKLYPTLGPGLKSMLNSVLDPYEGSDFYGCTLELWVEMLNMSAREVHRTAKELVGLSIVSMGCD
jgi:hypothetical protein